MSVTINMKLSEAIREGAKLRPQLSRPGEGDFGFSVNRQICSCALGAAFEATGLVRVFDGGHEWPSQEWLNPERNVFFVWPVLYERLINPLETKGSCCAMLLPDAIVSEIITHLNDYHGWTREQIADWVEKVEVQHGL